MIEILYDHQIFCLQRRGGISRYFAELIASIHKAKDAIANVSLFTNRNLHLADALNRAGMLDRLRVPCIKGEWLLWKYLGRCVSERHLARSDYSLFHPTYYDPYWVAQIGDKPSVVTVYDLTIAKFPERFHPNLRDVELENMRQSIAAASRVICISENTRCDLVKTFGVDGARIDIVPLGTPSLSRTESRRLLRLPERFVLYVGTRHAYKNFRTFVSAIANRLVARGCHLLCIGATFTSDERRFLNDLGILDRCIAMPLDDGDLFECYRRATCFCFPSLYEGFGLPILEAFSARCPVALSNTSSFPEVAGDAALYFNPSDTTDIAETIDRLLVDRRLANELVERGTKRLQKFTAQKTTEKTLAVYRRVIEETCHHA